MLVLEESSGFAWTGRTKETAMALAKNTICLWYDKDAEDAARFYASVFPDSRVDAVREIASKASL